MDVAIFVPLTFFLMIASIVWVVQHYAAKKRIEALQTLRAAIDKGQPISQELLETMTRTAANPYADLRKGIISLSIALGFAILGALIAQSESEALIPMLGVAAFPFCLGLGFIVLHVFTRGPSNR